MVQIFSGGGWLVGGGNFFFWYGRSSFDLSIWVCGSMIVLICSNLGMGMGM